MKKRNQEQKHNFIYRNFKTALIDLKKERGYVGIASIIFIGVAILGFFMPMFFEDKVRELIQELILKTMGLSPLELTQFIIANNMTSSFIAMIMGIFLMIPSIAIIVINGYVIGVVANKSVEVAGITILWRLLPHGIFEIPAILISVGLGIKIGFNIMHNCIRKYNKKMHPLAESVLIVLSLVIFPFAFFFYIFATLIDKQLRKNFSKNLIDALRIFVFIVIPLLIIAGIIEGILIALVA